MMNDELKAPGSSFIIHHSSFITSVVADGNDGREGVSRRAEICGNDDQRFLETSRASSGKVPRTNARYITLLPTETGGPFARVVEVAGESRTREAQVPKDTKGYGRRGVWRRATACELLLRRGGRAYARARRGGSPADAVRRRHLRPLPDANHKPARIAAARAVRTSRARARSAPAVAEPPGREFLKSSK